MIKRISTLILSVLFALFAFFQWNDPDSLPWILLYLSVSGLFLLAFLGRRLTWAAWGLALVLLVGMLVYAQGAWEFLTNKDGIGLSEGMQNDYLYIEQAREFGGLAIALLAVLGLGFYWNGQKKNG